MNPDKGIEFSSGSLGLGLALGVGTAMGLRKRDNHAPRVFVLMGRRVRRRIGLGKRGVGIALRAVKFGSHHRQERYAVRWPDQGRLEHGWHGREMGKLWMAGANR